MMFGQAGRFGLFGLFLPLPIGFSALERLCGIYCVFGYIC